MHNTVRMRGGKDHRRSARQSEPPARSAGGALDQRRHRAAMNSSRCKLAVDLPSFENRADIRMPEVAAVRASRSAVRMRDIVGFGLEHLDRDIALQLRIRRR
mgnify:CR=1 FL=1